MFKRITFEAAAAYAAGKAEQYRDLRMIIRLIVTYLGIECEVHCFAVGRHTISNELISWHDIEHGHYDALRLGIDKAIEVAFNGGRMDRDQG